MSRMPEASTEIGYYIPPPIQSRVIQPLEEMTTGVDFRLPTPTEDDYETSSPINPTRRGVVQLLEGMKEGPVEVDCDIHPPIHPSHMGAVTLLDPPDTPALPPPIHPTHKGLIQPLEEKSIVVEVTGEHKFGAEHSVWLDGEKQMAHKVLHWFGNLWQTPRAPKGLGIMRDYYVPLVPAAVQQGVAEISYKKWQSPPMEDTALDSAIVSYVEYLVSVRRQVTYLMDQLLFSPSHPLNFGDLMRHERYRQEIRGFTRKGGEIHKIEKHSLDMLGGKAFTLLPPALNPFRRKMYAEITNILVADDTITTPVDWPDYGLKAGDVVAEPGDMMLCDARMYDLDREDTWFNRNVVRILEQIHEMQYAALCAMLEHFGMKTEMAFETKLQRFTRWTLKRGAPKMTAYVEEQIETDDIEPLLPQVMDAGLRERLQRRLMASQMGPSLEESMEAEAKKAA